MTDEVEITNENFNEYFFDARRYKAKPGQILAKFMCFAVFGPGQPKKDVIHLLKVGKAKEAALVMNKIHCARIPDCYRLCRKICEDLLFGYSEEEVENKEYEFVLESFYYTHRECVPKDSPYWFTIDVLDFDAETNTFRSIIH